MAPARSTLHGFSVDVEDWFHILDCEGAPDTTAWDNLEDRVTHGTTRVLNLLDRFGHKATFFVLGWVAERHPELIADIVARGHEIGSHGHTHQMVSHLDRDSFLRDLDRSLEAIGKAAGCDVTAFRAPGFSIGPAQNWALTGLASRGITTDSSLFLARRAHGGYPLDRARPFTIHLPDGKSLLEVPVVPFSAGPAELPYSGGGYLRLLPTPILDAFFARADSTGEPAIAYLHPRELDPLQPRMDLPPWRAFKYYVGLRSVDRKLETLFARYRFGTLTDVARAGDLDEPLRLAA